MFLSTWPRKKTGSFANVRITGILYQLTKFYNFTQKCLAKTWPKHILWHNGGQNWNLWCLVGHEKVFRNTKHYFGQDRSVRSHKCWNQEKSMNLWNLRMLLDLKNAWFFTVFWPNLGQITSWYSTCVLEMSQMVFECPFISLECVKMYSGQDLAKKHPITVLVIVFTDMKVWSNVW